MATNKSSKGGRNLLLLAFFSVIIAGVSIAASLHIYRVTGDIYLDRSRPGYIAEDEVHNNEDDGKEIFSKDGEINKQVLEEFLESYDEVFDRIEKSGDSFNETPVSDFTLGIDSAEQTN